MAALTRRDDREPRMRQWIQRWEDSPTREAFQSRYGNEWSRWLTQEGVSEPLTSLFWGKWMLLNHVSGATWAAWLAIVPDAALRDPLGDEYSNDEGWTLAEWCVQMDRADCLRAWLARGDWTAEEGWRWMELACERTSDVACFRVLDERFGWDPSHRLSGGDTWLHRGLPFAEWDLVEWWLDRGVDPEARNDAGAWAYVGGAEWHDRWVEWMERNRPERGCGLK